MAGNIADKITDTFSSANPNSARVNSPRVAAATSLTCDNLAGWPTGSAVHFSTYTIDTNSKKVAGTQIDWKGLVTSSTTIGSMTRQAGATDTGNTVGQVVEMMPTASWSHDLFTGLTNEHNQLDGTHSTALITARTEDTAPDVSNDYLLTYDTSATSLKKVKPSNLGLLSGWQTGALPAVSSVTANGNHSYDVTFASTVAATLTPGQRLRLSRTVAAPTQCTSLNGTTQYYSRTSANLGSTMTFTDDFVVSAWVKLSSYPASGQATIAARWNGTQGWQFLVSTSGQVYLQGSNAAATNYSQVLSYQSLPLNKWVHVAAQLDMSAFTATTTTSYIMIDGVDVPASVARAGTNPTALVQAGNLEIGATNTGAANTFFPGKIAQVAIYSAKVTQATIKASINQTLSGTETSLISAYSFNNSINDLNANANNLTANGSAVATNADSPFALDANGVPGGTYEWGIVTKVSTTVATVQTPEGSAIPTSGGVSAVDMSAWKAPYGMPAQRGKWLLRSIYRSQTSTAINNTTAQLTGGQFTLPIGSWQLKLQLFTQITSASLTFTSATIGLSTSSSSLTADLGFTQGRPTVVSTATSETDGQFRTEQDYDVSAQTTIYLLGRTGQSETVYYGDSGSSSPTLIEAECAYL